MSANSVPTTNDSKAVKAFSFPFGRSSTSFPAMEENGDRAYSSILSLLNTAPWERVMNIPMGVDIYKYIFDTLTPIKRVRLASEISAQIEKYIPNVRVENISISELSTVDRDKNGFIFDIEYSISGQSDAQKIYFDPSKGRFT